MVRDFSPCLAIIPARGGSKGIPRKNVTLLNGKPLICYSIEHARQSRLVDEVIVSTDDAEIGEISRQCGAEICWRPAAISDDYANSESALCHVLDERVKAGLTDPEIVVFLQATSPLRRDKDIDNAISLFRERDADSLFSGCEIHGFVWQPKSEGLAPLDYNPRQRPRRQETSRSAVEENGSIYVFKPWVLRQFNSRLGGKIECYLMRGIDSFQVDLPEDLPLVEDLLKLRSFIIPSGTDCANDARK